MSAPPVPRPFAAAPTTAQSWGEDGSRAWAPVHSEDEPVLRTFGQAIRRRAGLVAGTFTAAMLLGGALLTAIRPTYQAATSIRIDQRQAGVPVLDFFLKELSASDVFTEQATLGSRSLVEGVTDSLGLALLPTRPARAARSALFSQVRVTRQAGGGEYRLVRRGPGYALSQEDTARSLGTFPAGRAVEAAGFSVRLAPGIPDDVRFRVLPFAQAVQRVQKGLKVERPDRDANVIVLSYRDKDPELTRDVPNAVAGRFIASRHAVQQSVARSTAAFLRSQLDSVGAQLSGAEDALRDYRAGRRAVDLPAEQTARVNQLAQLEAERNQTRAERDALASLVAEAQRDAGAGVRSPYRRLVAFPTIFRNQSITELLRSLGAAEEQRSALLNRRTPEDQDVRVLTARVGEVEQQLQQVVTTYLQGLDRQVASLDGELAASGRALAALPARERDLTRLERNPKLLAEAYGVLQTRLRDAQIAEAVADPSVRVIDAAALPLEPASPKPPLVLAASALLGVFGGTGLAWWRESRLRGVRTRGQVLAATGLPVLGVIPRRDVPENAVVRATKRVTGRGIAAVDAAPGRTRRPLLTLPGGWNPALEAYRTLRTNLMLGAREGAPHSVIVTSALPGEGKTATAANLAALYAWEGRRVVLVDADLRRGALGAAFGGGRGPGLVDVLMGRSALTDAVRPVYPAAGDGTALPSFDLMPTGAPTASPAELLGNPSMSAVLGALRERYDVVIVDTPPLGIVTDAAVLGAQVDGAILVARSGVTPSELLTRTAEQLRAVSARVLGAVLTDVDDVADADGYASAVWREYRSYAPAT